MDYHELIREVGYLNTGINTRINEEFRISSIFRRYSNANFEGYGWETFLWNGNRIQKEYGVLYSADDVVNLHTKIAHEFFKVSEEN
ncbi:hypothetical protein M3649_03570 [Ureibacillus chungkukjangi]|uniref:hypothetical protein n=1 Tax=Ureibacillus chungkukjangi TaxID=1202712 RepID=UPI002040EF90|nr:hypothetical protein [Ureibacillus chungkukjangi]MCM3387209.1 hypothetical protein [Ureibacillus chungkukjangi]